jgi:serine/threonine protein kinase
MTIEIGTTIKGYQIREKIGEGGFARVYRAYQPALAREVAMKVILPQHANNPDFVRRFETEAQTVARLEHIHIVPLYDYWREPDNAFLVMRWIRGGSLAQAITGTPWELGRATRFFDQVADGLYAAHRGGVVHRDIKPDNMLLDEDGNAYLTDFAIVVVATFSPDDQRIVAGYENGDVVVWDVNSKEIVFTLRGHTASIADVQFAPDSETVITSSEDNTVKVWNISMQKFIRRVCQRLVQSADYVRDFTDEERILANLPDNQPTCPLP